MSETLLGRRSFLIAAASVPIATLPAPATQIDDSAVVAAFRAWLDACNALDAHFSDETMAGREAAFRAMAGARATGPTGWALKSYFTLVEGFCTTRWGFHPASASGMPTHESHGIWPAIVADGVLANAIAQVPGLLRVSLARNGDVVVLEL